MRDIRVRKETWSREGMYLPGPFLQLDGRASPTSSRMREICSACFDSFDSFEQWQLSEVHANW